jgi:hypothetical protein
MTIMTTKKKLQLLLNGNKTVFVYRASQLDELSGWSFEDHEMDENIQIEINAQGEAFWCYEDHEDQLETCDDPEKVIEQVFALEN